MSNFSNEVDNAIRRLSASLHEGRGVLWDDVAFLGNIADDLGDPYREPLKILYNECDQLWQLTRKIKRNVADLEARLQAYQSGIDGDFKAFKHGYKIHDINLLLMRGDARRFATEGGVISGQFAGTRAYFVINGRFVRIFHPKNPFGYHDPLDFAKVVYSKENSPSIRAGRVLFDGAFCDCVAFIKYEYERARSVYGINERLEACRY